MPCRCCKEGRGRQGSDFENAAKLRDEEKSKREAMEARKKEWADQQIKSHGAVTEDDIAAVISGWTVFRCSADRGRGTASACTLRIRRISVSSVRARLQTAVAA